MFQFCSTGKCGVLNSRDKRRVGDLVRGTGPRRDALHREYEADAFYLAEHGLGLGAFGVSMLICAMFI
jgi:hypothetical protein